MKQCMLGLLLVLVCVLLCAPPAAVAGGGGPNPPPPPKHVHVYAPGDPDGWYIHCDCDCVNEVPDSNPDFYFQWDFIDELALGWGIDYTWSMVNVSEGSLPEGSWCEGWLIQDPYSPTVWHVLFYGEITDEYTFQIQFRDTGDDHDLQWTPQNFDPPTTYYPMGPGPLGSNYTYFEWDVHCE